MGFRPGGRPELAGVMKGFVWHAQQAGAQVRTESLTAMSRNGGALPSLRADRGAVLHLRREQVHILGQRRDAHHVRHGDAARGIAIDEVAPRPSASKGDSRVWTLIAIKLGGTEIKLDVHGDPIPTEDGTRIPKHQISLTRVSRHHYRVAFVLTRHDLKLEGDQPPKPSEGTGKVTAALDPNSGKMGLIAAKMEVCIHPDGKTAHLETTITQYTQRPREEVPYKYAHSGRKFVVSCALAQRREDVN